MRRMVLAVMRHDAETLRRADQVRRDVPSDSLVEWSNADIHALVDLLGRSSADLDSWEEL